MRTVQDDLLDLARTIGWPQESLTNLGGNVLGLVRALPVLDVNRSYGVADWPTVEVIVTIEGSFVVTGCVGADDGDHADDPVYFTDEDEQVVALIHDVQREAGIALGYCGPDERVSVQVAPGRVSTRPGEGCRYCARYGRACGRHESPTDATAWAYAELAALANGGAL